MLKGTPEELDMKAKSIELTEKCRSEIAELKERFGFFAISVLTGIETVEIAYPVVRYLEKINSFNFDKDPVVEGTLLGVKGQYLIFDTGVINMRRFSGYDVEVSS